MLSILLNGNWAVIHYTDASDGSMYVRKGIAPETAPSSLKFEFAGSATTFTQELINSLEEVKAVLSSFAEQGTLVMDDEWEQM